MTKLAVSQNNKNYSTFFIIKLPRLSISFFHCKGGKYHPSASEASTKNEKSNQDRQNYKKKQFLASKLTSSIPMGSTERYRQDYQ
jgi:hypothetical protein